MGGGLVADVRERLILAVQKNLPSCCGILFSGGLDSAVLAAIAKEHAEITCYTAGLAGSQDVEFAARAADAIGVKLKTKIIKEKEVESYAQKVIDTINDTNAMKVGVGIPVYACCEIADEKTILSGLGAEELFAGYHKFKKYVGQWSEMRRVLADAFSALPEKDISRDTAIAAYFGKELRTPYLDPDFANAVMRIHPQYKISETENKILLRHVAAELGLPKFICNRPKKATQYGSGIDKALRKNTKARGMKIQDYLNWLSAKGKNS